MGAWIEILNTVLHGLDSFVAPFVGAWIEILLKSYMESKVKVAPFVGAWIEIRKATKDIATYASLPSWERGLKYECYGAGKNA